MIRNDIMEWEWVRKFIIALFVICLIWAAICLGVNAFIELEYFVELVLSGLFACLIVCFVVILAHIRLK